MLEEEFAAAGVKADDYWKDGVAEPDDYLLPGPWHLHCDGPPEKCVAFAARPLETLCRACREERLRRMSPTQPEVDWSDWARNGCA